jgi:hypothetical protein
MSFSPPMASSGLAVVTYMASQKRADSAHWAHGPAAALQGSAEPVAGREPAAKGQSVLTQHRPTGHSTKRLAGLQSPRNPGNAIWGKEVSCAAETSIDGA